MTLPINTKIYEGIRRKSVKPTSCYRAWEVDCFVVYALVGWYLSNSRCLDTIGFPTTFSAFICKKTDDAGFSVIRSCNFITWKIGVAMLFGNRVRFDWVSDLNFVVFKFCWCTIKKQKYEGLLGREVGRKGWVTDVRWQNILIILTIMYLWVVRFF